MLARNLLIDRVRAIVVDRIAAAFQLNGRTIRETKRDIVNKKRESDNAKEKGKGIENEKNEMANSSNDGGFGPGFDGNGDGGVGYF